MKHKAAIAAPSTRTRSATRLQGRHDTRQPQSVKHASQTALGLQAALRVGKSGDPYERQADRMADRVVAGDHALFADTAPLRPQLDPAPQASPEDMQAQEAEEEPLQARDEEEPQTRSEDTDALQAVNETPDQTRVREHEDASLQAEENEPEQLPTPEETESLWASDGGHAPLQAAEDEENGLQASDGEKEKLQATDSLRVPRADTEQALAAARQQSGSPLQPAVRERMERAFAQDFSGVRIHTDQAAVQLNHSLGARALTSGEDIWFTDNAYQPASREGEHLLAHELTHVVQQREAANTPVQLQAKALPENYEIRPELLRAVNNARSRIGLVNAKLTDADGNRIGWELLRDFFNTAFGGQHPLNETVIQKIVMGKDTNGNPKDALPSWCGIFVWWSLKSAGLPIPDWKLGLPVLEKFRIRPKSELPRKGDIAYRKENQHFAIVSGVEMQGGVLRIATINGNTAGQDNLGGQIQEQWHGLSGWLGFFDTAAKLDLPPVPLVTTGSAPDVLMHETPAEAGTADTALTGEKEEATAELPAVDEPLLEAPVDAEVATELPDIPPAPVLEANATVAPLAFDGSSDQAVQSAARASASQLALDGDRLGGQVSTKLAGEQQTELAEAPALQVNLAGNVGEGLTPANELMPAATELTGEVSGPDDAPRQTTPHEFAGPAPSNEQRNEELEKEARNEGFLDWLRANFRSLLDAIRTEDPNLNTRAGPTPRVQLDGNANPGQMTTQRADAGNALRGKRDELTDNLKTHPGQGNIQARAVHESKPVQMQNPEPAPMETTLQPEAGDYATAELPQPVRDKADEELGRLMAPSLDQAEQEAQDAAETKQQDKDGAIRDAEKETERLNKAADDEQRTLVIDNRRSVAAQQKAGIEEAYGTVNTFEQDAGKEQKDRNRLIGDKITEKEGEADRTLKNAEKEADDKKKEEEGKAREQKRRLDEEQKKQSWWERAKNAIKSAVKAITEAIDKIFTALRDAVKKIIDTAKNLAIAAINAARDFAVARLNEFRDWAKNQVNTYLGSTFPGLASVINRGIDATVDVAIAGVNLAADGAIAGIEALANSLAAALDKILSVFQTALKAAVQIIGAVLTGDFVEALKIAIRAGCEIAGIDSQPIFDFLERAGSQLVAILKKPVAFFNNLVGAVALGVRTFVKNIRQHLIKGLIGWLTGALAETPITLPETFDVKGIFTLVMQILGLTYANIRARVIRKYPQAEKVISAIEKGVEIVYLLVTKGPIALWEMVKTSMANLKEMVMGAIRNFVITTVVKEAVTWLLGLLNPAGALVKILKLLFDLVMFLVQRFNQIRDFVLSVYNALSSLASGAIGQAAAAVENAMARSLPVVIGLLASLAGLGGIGKTINGIIKKVTEPINRVIDKVIDRIVAFGKKLLQKGKDVVKKVKDRIVQWWTVRRRFTAVTGETHTLFFKGEENSAVLTLRSVEQPYQDYMNSLDESDFDATRKKHLKMAKDIAAQIDAKRREKVGGNTDAEKEKNSKAKQDAIEKLLEKLGDSTGHLFGTSLPEWQQVSWSGVNAAGFGAAMEIKVLTRQGKGWQGGSKPTQSQHKTYDVLNLRRQSGGASFYIRGHLLNDNLGGPGKWDNMTPLSREGNHQHEAQLESFVKAGFNAGAIQRYRVKPIYTSRSDGEPLKQSLEKRDPANAATYAKIIDAESHVPIALEIELARRVQKGNDFEDKEKKSLTVLNPIDRSADQYFLTGAKKREPVYVNTLKDTAPLLKFNDAAEGTESWTLQQDLHAQAPAIVKAVRKRGAENLPGFGTYAVMARETEQAGGTLTEDRAKAWNTAGYILLK